jgi:hypothetical protein
MPTVGIKLKVVNKKLVPINAIEKEKLDYIKKAALEGSEIYAIIDWGEEAGERSQVKKIYAMMNILAAESMMPLDSIKDEIKEKAGFYEIKNGIKHYKSLSNPQHLKKSELNQVIEAIYTLGEFLNINLKKQF